LLLGFFLVQCAGHNKENNGVESTIIETGDGPKVRHGEYLLVDMDVLMLDSVLHRDEPGLLYQIRYDTYMNRLAKVNPLEKEIYNLSKGDSAVLHTADNLTAHVRVVDIVDYSGYTKWRLEQTRLRKVREDLKMKETLRRESTTIDSVLNASHQEFETTPSGIRYIMVKDGIGDVAQDGDTVLFDFHAVFLDGKELPNGVGLSGSQPRSFVMGSEQVFPCWRESIGMLNKRSSGKFYFPSAMAFGSKEIVGIPANSIIATEITLVDIRRIKR
jgi:FKBP-type peptidyl-prolyl cis-trans isomerase